MKGILLAGGTGSRLFPMTLSASKQLMPIYDKPMIYYPLSTLMLGGMKDIVVISTPRDLPQFRELLGDGSQWGVSFQYVQQDRPAGIAQAFILAEPYTRGEDVCLILGDNIYHGVGLQGIVRATSERINGATVFAYNVTDPERYGVVEFEEGSGRVLSIEEKPEQPKSNFAVTGLYMCDKHAADIAKDVKPSGRGELEITDVLNAYLAQNKLKVECLSRGIAWLDTGTPASLLEASSYISVLEKRQGLKVACLEEIAWRLGYIDDNQLIRQIDFFGKSPYGQYLKNLLH